jgi:parvulin-like peptidyl-prolyl isomerase
LITLTPSDDDIEIVLEKANQVHAIVVGGAPFDSVAEVYSTDEAAGEGGDLGWLKIGDLPDFFQDVLTTMQPGDVSPVLRETAGFRIVKLLEEQKERTYDYDEIRAELQNLYTQKKMGTMFEDYVAELRSKFHVERMY